MGRKPEGCGCGRGCIGCLALIVILGAWSGLSLSISDSLGPTIGPIFHLFFFGIPLLIVVVRMLW